MGRSHHVEHQQPVEYVCHRALTTAPIVRSAYWGTVDGQEAVGRMHVLAHEDQRSLGSQSG